MVQVKGGGEVSKQESYNGLDVRCVKESVRVKKWKTRGVRDCNRVMGVFKHELRKERWW